MVTVIHAPTPVRAFNPSQIMDSFSNTPVPTRRAQPRKHKHPRDKMNARPQTLSLGFAAQRLHFGSNVFAAIVSKPSESFTPVTDAASPSQPQAPLTDLPKRPALQRRNAIRVIHPAACKKLATDVEIHGPVSDIDNHPFSNGTAASPSSQPLYLGNTLLALCATIAGDILAETAPDSDEKVSVRQGLRTLRRKYSMCPLLQGGPMGSIGDSKFESANVIFPLSLLPGVDKDADLLSFEDLESDLSHTTNLVEVVDTGRPALSPPSSPAGRTLTQIIKGYWARKYRPRPSSRGQPSLDTIEELPDSTLDTSVPFCQFFGHPMVRTKAKRPVRRPKMRTEN
ncbi:hypothetical protein BC628DRAFT_64372 [Trametes gibbosa]|nr:hypothetical protein BC628DRAFT_64372 [Trametes gibbosa]